jgi:multicomponent Na+:H+ antiporter subunit F
MTMFAAAAAAIIVAMTLAIARAVAGPTLYDRVLAGNSFGTKTVLLIGVMGYLTGRPDFLDIALLYALLNFAATIAILKFFRYRTLSVSMVGAEADKPRFEEVTEEERARG